MDKPTMLFINNQDMEYGHHDGCHGGGPFKLKDVVGKVKDKGLLRFLHDDIVLPGSSFGDHTHNDAPPFEEWYFYLAGHDVMTCDGKEHPMGPGDISVCYTGGTPGSVRVAPDNGCAYSAMQKG